MEESSTNLSLARDHNQLLINCNNVIQKGIAKTWNQTNDVDFIKSLSNEIDPIVVALVNVGRHAHDALEKSDGFIFQNALISYNWGEYAKAFGLLWRNILFNEQEAFLQLQVQHIAETDFQKLRNKSHEVVKQAAEELHHFIEKETSKYPNQQKELERWELQNNPWPVYQEQLESLPEQCHQLLQQSDQLQKAATYFELIKGHFNLFFKNYSDKFISNSEVLEKTIRSFQEDDSFTTEQVATEMNTLLGEIQQLTNINVFNDQLNDYLDTLPKEQRFYMHPSQGMLPYKELDLQKQTKDWLNAELMPKLFELKTLRETILNKTETGIASIRNRIHFDKQNEEVSAKIDVAHPLQNFVKNLKKSNQQITEMQKQIAAKTKADFDITKIYEESFLPVSMGYTINEYRNQQRKGLDNIRKWLWSKGFTFQKFQENIKPDDALSISEKMVRLVKQRTPEKENSYYTNIFLAEGWIGDSFVVGREDEAKRIDTLVENWKLGFRGDVLLTGQRLSGKTLFAQLVNKRFFNNNAIEIIPNTKLKVAGRHVELEKDLGIALNFVVKNTLNKPTMVLIDNLEYWADDKITLTENVRKLFSTIDQYTGRLFFVVVMSNWLKTQLQRNFEVNRIFQCEVNLDRMSKDEIEQTIFIRHSSTHMELVDQDMEEVQRGKFRSFCHQIYQSSEGNIGEALHQWAYLTKKHNDEFVMKKNEERRLLPGFLSMDTSLLLWSILMARRTNEFQLAKVFGAAFQERYKVLLSRLINLGIVKRNRQWLEINPFLVNDITRELSTRLNFDRENKLEIDRDVKL